MKKVKLITKNLNKGFSSIEVLLAISIFAMLTLGVASALFYSIQSTSEQSRNLSANYLADENLESVSSIAYENFTSLANGTYHLGVASNEWAMLPGSETIDGTTRSFTIADGLDADTKLITSQVTWDVNGSNRSVSLSKYLTNWNRIVSTASWLNPIQEAAGNISTSRIPRVVKYSGNYAVVIFTSGSPNIAVFDFSNPLSITQTSSLSLAGNLLDLEVIGDYAYVISTDNAKEFIIVNLTNKNAISELSSVNLGRNTNPTKMSISGNVVAVGRLSSGTSHELAFINVTNKNTPSLIREITNLNTQVNDLLINENYLYIGTSQNTREIIVYDITNILTTNPTFIVNFNLAGNNTTNLIEIGNGCLFVYVASGNIKVLSLTTPSTFTESATIAHGTTVYDIDYNDTNKFLFVASTLTSKQFTIYNVATPATPVEYSFLATANEYSLEYMPLVDKVIAVTYAGTTGQLILIKPN